MEPGPNKDTPSPSAHRVAVEEGEIAERGDSSEAGAPSPIRWRDLGWGAKPEWFLERPALIQFFCWFAIVLVVKHASLLEPPVWDSAMGVFPPAIYLFENGFDIRSLLQEGGWEQGGPNVHSLSLLTWVIAGVMAVTNSPQATFVIIHLLIFAAFAWTLELFTRVLRSYGLAASTVLVAASALLLMPLVLVQVGSMYTESLVMGTGVAAWAFWREGRPGLSVFFCVVGIFLKLTALAVAMLVFAVLLLSMRPLRVRKVMLLAAIPGALVVNLLLAGWLGATPPAGPDWGTADQLLTKFGARMRTVPDLKLLLQVALLSSALYVLLRIWRDRGMGLITRSGPDSRSRLICLGMPFVFLGGVIAMIYSEALFLSRYLLPVLPFAIGAILLFATQIRAERVVCVLLLVFCLYSAINFDGRLYHPQYASFSTVERSHAYRDFHAVQVMAIEGLNEKSEEVPAFVSREVDYMISHRMMGYVEKPIPNTFPIYVSPYWERALDEFPQRFLLLRTNNGHGGGKMGRLVREAEASSSYQVSEKQFEQAGFRATLYEVRRISGAGGISLAPVLGHWKLAAEIPNLSR